MATDIKRQTDFLVSLGIADVPHTQKSYLDFDDLCRVHLYDLLEQIQRLQDWDYRRMGYRRMAERLGPVAIAAYDRVFAQEPAAENRV